MKKNKADSITVQDFIVEERWVNVTTSIPAYGNHYLGKRPSGARACYGEDVYHLAVAILDISTTSTGRIRSSEEILMEMRADPLFRRIKQFYRQVDEKEAVEVTVSLKRCQWEDVVSAADKLDISPAVFVRTALMERAARVRAFDRAAEQA